MQSIGSLYNVKFGGRLVFFLFLIITFYAKTALSVEREISIDKSRSVIITLPKGWRLIRTILPSERPAKNIKIINGDYVIIVSLIGTKDGSLLNISDEKIVSAVKKGAQQHLPNSVEENITVHKMQSNTIKGAYASFTDKTWVGKQPTPGEFRHVTNCALVIGKSIFGAVTYLSNEIEGEIFKEGLTILKNLRSQE
ncbi:hypothetical protein [Zooshikella harenae]|uniref:PsbP C-terminal domain-containing protein n=1 Tax=Zooshikella harenae TaxID=2827238 RepID=A0ABS5ZHR6_9GAMM|nr:hypothetical protein [Zooshikella harenae]MBU2713606.1 hypothetical protein [Zooshikella harenae]